MRSTHRAGIRSSYQHTAGRRRPLRNRGAFTLLEVLIATAVTLLMMISLVQVFKVIGDSMKQGRAALQMNNTLRSVTTRLRQDLGNLTVRVDPPSDNSSGGGYFEYFDGSMTDYTAALFPNDAPRSNRFGDTDDILMFTARAGSSWFTGQVPSKIVNGVTGTAADDLPIVITSQLAEIAVFAQPVLSPATTGQPFDDFDGNLFPDNFRLHYRVLLVRPDLNVVGTGPVRSLPGMFVASGNESPTTMASFFANCDLSMHRIYDGLPANADLIAANSLEDLANPANRFAHYQYSLANLGTNASCTMPLLVLEPINNTVFDAFSFAGNAYADPNPVPPVTPAQLVGANGNFLSSAYVLAGDRTGEDVIANNVLAFDVKGFDPGAPVIAIPGPDGGFGLPQTGPPAFTGIAGQDGTDDLVLTPNDPGFAAGYAGTFVTISYGEYVDLAWGRKALYSLKSSAIPGSGNFFSALSGLESTTVYSDGLIRSGKFFRHPTGGAPIFFFQPTYDTWTTAFESNGTSQAQLRTLTSNTNDVGTVDVNALVRKNGWSPTDSVPTIDTGTDGLDNPINGVTSGGVDDTTERETLPPFPIRLRGIKVSVRLEDLSLQMVKQMSVASEFSTQ